MADKVPNLEEIRSNDEKVDQNESIKDKQSLNSTKIREFLESNTPPITLDNFDNNFTFEVGLKLLESSSAHGDKILAKELGAAHELLEKIELGSLMDDQPTEASFRAELHNVFLRRNIPITTENNIVNAYNKYQLVKRLCKQGLETRSKMKETRGEQKEAIEEMNLQEQLEQKWKEVKKNFKGMSDKKKLMTAGAMIGVVWLISESNGPRMTIIKNKIWGALKLAGVGLVGGVAVNNIWELFTGKSALEAIFDETTNKVGNVDFYKKHFDADEEKAQLMAKSIVFAGDKRFSLLAEKYKSAKASGDKKIELPLVSTDNITPEELYTALDTFFSKKGYEVDTLLKKHKNNPSIKFNEVVGDELVESGFFDGAENIPGKVADFVEDKWDRGWNYLMSSGVAIALYKAYHGEQQAPMEKVEDWIKSFIDKENIIKQGELNSYIDSKFGKKYGAGFKSANDSGTPDRATSTNSALVAGDGIYVISSVNLDLVGGDADTLSKALKKAETQACSFLVAKYGKKYPGIKNNPYNYLQFLKGTRALTPTGSEFKLFVRMPEPGTKDFANLNAGVVKPSELKEAENTD